MLVAVVEPDLAGLGKLVALVETVAVVMEVLAILITAL
jgi:hypothetical protein